MAGRHFHLKNNAAWLDAWHDPDAFEQGLRLEDDHDYLHPVFVWWHTLAHRLINALSIDSGYSSAAVRERVYIDIDPTTGEARGGILLYTAQPAGDGTLGGMIALVPTIHSVERNNLARGNIMERPAMPASWYQKPHVNIAIHDWIARCYGRIYHETCKWTSSNKRECLDGQWNGINRICTVSAL